ncbi:MAG: DsbC family protein [Oceanococcus sp.]|nr:MAG: DsbC family protein [Oceanococcus sp.]
MKRLIMGLLLASTAATLHAADDASGKIKTLRDKLSNSFPTLKTEDISTTPVKGIYQVNRGVSFGYVTEDAKYFFDGDLIDLKNAVSLTEGSRKSLRLEVLDKIGEDKMITFAAKNQKHEMTVFTDIDCGYCRKLHREMAEYNDAGITVHYVFYPRSGPNTPSFKKAEEVWCSKDQNKAMTEAKDGRDVSAKACSTPVMEHFRAGQEIGVRGTPALVLDDGTMQPGYVPAKRLAQLFAQQN